ncbi:MAG: type 1 glutamine amidotransferase domain-containing protein [Desulfuromonadales bacterium]|nr:type 1 glutamine amidotransferase domain-containing protein [Desulfuromonadales bacterium]
MKLTGKTIAILAEDLYEDLELWYPLMRLREEGATVEVIGTGKPTYTSKHGYPVDVTNNAERVKWDEFDAIIIPGGYAPDHMRRHRAMVNLVKDAVQNGRIVAAICHAGWMLASADVLRGRKVTSFSAIKDDLINAGAEYLDREVVQDANLITSRVPSDLPAFCRTIIAALVAA